MATAILENVKYRTKLLKTVVNVAGKYFSELSKYIAGTNPTEYSILSESISRSDTAISRLENCSGITLEEIYNVYEDYITLETDIGNYILMFNNAHYSRAAISEMSSGQHANMRADINRVITNYETYKLLKDDEIFETLMPITKREYSVYYKFLYEHRSVNALTNELIRRLLPVVDNNQKLFLDDLLLEQKRGIFAVGIQARRVRAGKMVGHEGVIFRYNLHPLTISLPIAELFGVLKLKWTDGRSVHENLVDAATHGANIVLINRVSSTPIEFDFRGVLDNDYTADMKIKPMSGLNKKFLARYNTTSVLDNSGYNSPPVTPAVKMYAHGFLGHYVNPHEVVTGQTDWYVIETINGSLYRALSNNDDFSVSGQDIMGLIVGVSLLPMQYNYSHSEWIKRTRGDMFDPTAKLYIDKYTNSKRSVASSDPIKNNLGDRLQPYIRERVESIKSSREFFELFASESFYTVVVDNITSVILKNDPLVDRLNSTEYNITLVARTNGVIRSFMKSIARVLKDETLPARTFVEYNRTELNNQLTSRYTSIIKKASDLLDADKIWTGSEITLREFIMTN